MAITATNGRIFPAEQFFVFAKWAQSCDCMSISPFVPFVSKCNTRLTKCCNQRVFIQ